VDVVEVDDAVGRNAVVLGRQLELGDQVTAGPCQSGNYHRTDPVGDRIAGEDQDGAVAAGVAANQTSPRCIGPVRPVLRNAPICDRGQRSLAVVERPFLPSYGVVLARQPHEVTVKRLAQELGAVDAKPVGPLLRWAASWSSTRKLSIVIREA
jgi:hypothetical protein